MHSNPKSVRKTNLLPRIHIDNDDIEIVNKAKNLGVVFNNSLTWSDHVVAACGKVFGMIRILWPLQYCTPTNIRILLAKTYLIPVLTCSSEVFASCDAKSKNRLNVTFNCITRYVYGLRKYDHVSAFSKCLLRVNFPDYLKIKNLILLHKILTSREPSHLYNRLVFSMSTRTRNLTQLRHRTLVSEWQYFTFVIRLWNALPTNMKNISNASLFKKYLYDYYINLNQT